jgi:hypothetical protein
MAASHGVGKHERTAKKAKNRKKTAKKREKMAKSAKKEREPGYQAIR